MLATRFADLRERVKARGGQRKPHRWPSRNDRRTSTLSVGPCTLGDMSDEQIEAVAERQCLDLSYSPALRIASATSVNTLHGGVDNHCRKSCHFRLRRMTSWGPTVLYAPDYVYDEVHGRLPKIARSSPVPMIQLPAHCTGVARLHNNQRTGKLSLGWQPAQVVESIGTLCHPGD